ncbi:F0F1 ATP synthase subunit B [Blattabacterium cuenoti]|uniref:F0F1 ATP synthase subunit B n=1 Tax=Blattabacterium cuenoti TaxID=1653831 RepID=UPI00163BE2EC|nr:F0F1 ATP synthase subunit B [Blattabacterium cuenoti]
MDITTPSFGLIFWNIIIFLILVFILSKFAWSPIIDFIDKREKKIIDSIEKANLLEHKLNEIEKEKNIILKNAYEEKDRIIKETIKIKKNIKLKAIKDGIVEKRNIIKNSKKIIDEEREKSFNLLKNEIKSISIIIAEKILKKELEKDIKQESFIKFLTEKYK